MVFWYHTLLLRVSIWRRTDGQIKSNEQNKIARFPMMTTGDIWIRGTPQCSRFKSVIKYAYNVPKKRTIFSKLKCLPVDDPEKDGGLSFRLGKMKTCPKLSWIAAASCCWAFEAKEEQSSNRTREW